MTRLLITVAHPDDETFGTGSVIAAAAESGAQVTVCCATRGEAGEAHGLDAANEIAAVRESELRSAGELLGVSGFVLLDYRDSGMAGDPEPGTLAGAPFEDVVTAVTRVIDDARPDVIVTLDPEHGDGHRDHAVIGGATLEACRTRPDLRVYVFALPRALLARWFAELQDVRPDSAHLDLDRNGLGRPDEDVTTVVDVAHVLAKREAAIALHRSQVSPFDGMPEDLRAAFLRTDRLIRVQPPWAGGELERSLV